MRGGLTLGSVLGPVLGVVLWVSGVGCSQEDTAVYEDVPFTPSIERLDEAAVDTSVVRRQRVRRQRAATDSSILPLDSLVPSDSIRHDIEATRRFPMFLSRLQATLETGGGMEEVMALAVFGPAALDSLAFREMLYPFVFEGALRDELLAAGPIDVERRGTERRLRLAVGFNRDGTAVPLEQADEERAATLVFDLRSGSYRLVRIETGAR